MTPIKVRTYLVLIVYLYIQFSYAQNEAPLPKGFSEKEKAGLVKGFQFKSNIITAAPSASVRTAAEWEEVEYLVLSWNNSYDDILSKIVKAGINECKVIIAFYNVTESTIRTKLKSSPYLMTNAEINNNVIFLSAPTNSIWIRDFAGNTVYSNEIGQLGLTDWRYNRNRNNDDTVPTAHATSLGIPIYVTDMVNTGGNFMADGLGNAFASELVISENDVTPLSHYGFYPAVRRNETQINAIMSTYMGINSYYKMPTLPYDGIHHIDMHMKLLDEETILVSKYPSGVSDGPQIEANINQLLIDKVSAFGTPYKIEWIDCPADKYGYYPSQYNSTQRRYGSYATYSNSVIVNKSILLPNYTTGDNSAAIARYEELMPGYNVVGIDVETTEDLISLSGAIHCITHTIGVQNPLLIVHQPVEEVNSGSSVQIRANVKHSTGLNNVKVLWRAKGNSTFNEALMSLESANNYMVSLPGTASLTDIEYYIKAQATSGKVLTRPLVAPNGFWTIRSQVTLSADEWAEKNISQAYPNPSINKINFNLKSIDGVIEVSVYNLLGQKLFSRKIENGSNGKIEINLQDKWRGQLIVLFEGDFGKIARKIIKI